MNLTDVPTGRPASHLASPVPDDGCLRREDNALVRGQGRFVHHINAPDLRVGVFLRAERARGHFEFVGLQTARSMPGICAIFTGEQFGQHTLPAINPLLPVEGDLSFSVLAVHRLAYVGQPLALIVGHDRGACEAAAQAITVHYLTDPQGADASSTTEDLPGVVHTRFGAPDQSCASDQLTVHTHLVSPRVISASLEPRAVVVRWDASTDTLEVHMGTQAPSRARSDIAATLGVAKSSVRVITADVGGAFGAKASVYPEDLVLALAAREIRGAIRWTATRLEEFASAMHGRGSDIEASLSIRPDGEFVELSAKFWFDLGAWLPFSGVVPLRNAARIVPGPYALGHVNVQGQAHRSHRAPVNIYRGAGRPEATLVMETLVDAAARRLDLDPLALRRQNLVRPEQMPWRLPSGETLDSGDYIQLLDTASEAFGYGDQRQQQRQRQAAGECVGIGSAFYVEPCGQGWESARVTRRKDGSVLVASGSPAQGQGHLTTYARIAAQALDCSEALVEVIVGDTAHCPVGIGTLASRSTAIGGSAIVKACQELRAREAAGATLPLTAECRFNAEQAWSAGCLIARVSIDIDTGILLLEKMTWADDAGRIVHPTLAQGQLYGGAAQGLGQALMEAIRYDADGQLQTGSFMDYALPRASDMPPIDIVSLQTPSPNNPLGAKGVGEAGCIGVPAAIMNAARDAIHGFHRLAPGCETPAELDLSFPLTAEQLWRALHRMTNASSTQNNHRTSS